MLAGRVLPLAALLASAFALPLDAAVERRALFQRSAPVSAALTLSTIQSALAGATDFDLGFAAELANALTTDKAGKHHLYFYSIDRSSTVNGGPRCGEVDAAPFMPAAIFEARNVLSLAAYAEATVRLYKVPAFNTAVKLGRCAANGYPVNGGGVQGVGWTPGGIMGPVCAERCKCSFTFPFTHGPRCRDQPDDPSADRWCSLCGPSTACPGCARNTVTIDLWYVTDDSPTVPPTAPPTTLPPTSPPNSKDELWFRVVRVTNYPRPINRCGEIDAAPRMPSTLFNRRNSAALQRYKDVTLKNYVVPGVGAKLELGRCAEVGYTVPAGSSRTNWAPASVMDNICKEKCECFYAGAFSGSNCANLPDDPANGMFCSLCQFYTGKQAPNAFNKIATIDRATS